MENYTEAAIKSRDILDMAGKVKVELDPKPSGKHVVDPGEVKIITKSGEVGYKRMDDALGSPQKPLTFDECAVKFRDCASSAVKKIADKNVDQVVELISGLEKVPDIREIISLLS